jgi:transcriptional regulator with XRE-family HTH domain
MRNMSVTELAVAVGVTPGAVSQWETGRFSPRQQVQVRIARALDVPWQMVFGLDSESVA